MKLTRQEVFNKVKQHAFTQGCKSMREDKPNSCAYRGLNNTTCFFGIFITDEEYKPEMEGITVEGLYSKYPLIFEKFDEEVDRYFLTRLQGIHDDFRVEYWKCELEEFADIHSLSYE